jgi:outer membrane protein assembly factor BamE
LLNQLKPIMRMQPRSINRVPASAAALCLALATCLAGCAAKNPLLDEPAPSAKISSAAPSVAPSVAPIGVQNTKAPRFFGIFSPYRPDVQQGNFISAEMMTQLKDGMKRKEGITREQVRFILGTPLLTDPFHGDRWDYVFRMQKGNGDIIFSRVAIFFKGNQLDRFDGSVLPTERDYLAIIAGTATAPKEPVATESK